jgi:hypothetical protein
MHVRCALSPIHCAQRRQLRGRQFELSSHKVKNGPRHVIERVECRARQTDKTELQRGCEAQPAHVSNTKLEAVVRAEGENLAVDVLVGSADTCSPFAEKREFPASATVHWQFVPRPMKDSHSPSDVSRPELPLESMDGRVATSSATTVSIPLGANGSSFPGAPPPERPASERIAKGMPAQPVSPHRSAADQLRARRTVRAVGAEADSPPRWIVVTAAPSHTKEARRRPTESR